MKLVPDDIDLAGRLSSGDIEAFDLIYSKYSGTLYKFGLKYLRSAVDAEGLVQSVFLKLWENRKDIKKELSFKSFLFTVAYNDICKTFRKRKYFRKFVKDKYLENSNLSFRIEERIGFRSILERVKQIINILPERQRTIFLKSREEGKTSKQIASELNLSPGTVDNYISNSIKLIRYHLRNEDLVMAFVLTFLLFV